MGNRAEWLSSYFAILGLGATAVALNTWLTPTELTYQLRHAKVTTLILEERFQQRDFLQEINGIAPEELPDLVHRVVLGDCPEAHVSVSTTYSFADLQDRARQANGNLKAAAWNIATANDIACILYTSGSTAQPKGVPLYHSGLIDNMWEIGERLRLSDQDRLWFGISLFWSFGCVNALFTMMSHGSSLVLQHHFDTEEAIRLIETERCTVLYGTPNMAQALLEHKLKVKADLSSLRTGAAIGTPEQMQMFVDLGAKEICNVYGLTEAFGNSCVSPCDAPLGQRLQSSGPPLDGVDLKILALETGSDAPQGEIGEIALRGRVTPGYLEDVVASTASFTSEGFFLTGDLGRLDEHGWLHFIGRRKELIKSGGINISAAEIEAVLREHETVASVFVTGLPDPRLDQIIGAAVVLENQDILPSETLITQLQAHCRGSLAAYKIPHRIVFTTAEALPVTSTGKLQRNRLHELFDDGAD